MSGSDTQEEAMNTPTITRPRPAQVSRFDCGECGMNVTATEFHPYWHCVLFRNGVDPRTIQLAPDQHDPK